MNEETVSEDGAEARGKARGFRGKGCLVAVCVFVALMVYSGWEVGEPGRRASRVRESIAEGMSLEQVEAAVSKGGGRYYVFYQVPAGDRMKTTERDEFVETMTATNYAARPRLQLTFMGKSPHRCTFEVEFDSDCRAAGVSRIRGWD